MFTVKDAIIMAAGRGSRMRELTETTPKPMLKVNGKRMIDSCIEGLLANGIKDIIIVVGYLKERFQEVADEYPEVRLVENPYYETANNISSIYVVREYLEDVMIIEGDQFFLNGSVFWTEFEHSGYNAFYSRKPTTEWVVETDETKRILSCSDHGADEGYVMYGVSRWSKEDGRKLAKWLEYEFEVKQNKDVFWDHIPLFLHADDFEIYVSPTENKSHVELDSVEEIAALDPSYEKYVRRVESE